MKTFKGIQAFLIICGLISPLSFTIAQKQSKEINKDYVISKGDILKIENKFGKIDIQTWDKSEVSISVKLSAEAKSDASAKSIIDNMSVEFKKEDNSINAITSISNETGMNNSSHFSVDYLIFVPKWIDLNLNNKFGDIIIDEISGKVMIDLKHGNLRIMSLTRGNEKPLNEIIMAFSNGAIEQAGSLKLILSFSKLEMEDADILLAETKYSGINSENCNSFVSDSKYDNFKFNEIGSLSGDLKYSNLRIGKFTGKLELESAYSGIKIDEVLPSFESMKITNSRGAYKIGVHPEISCDFSGESNHGDISLEGFTILEKKTEGTSKTIRAYSGSEGTGKIINISTAYGSVSLYKD